MTTTILDVRRFKEGGTRFAMLTAYDYPTAQALDQAGVPLVLVGDTLGIFALGHPTTIPVTLEAAIHHCQSVVRGVADALVVGDMPFGSYQVSDDDGMRNALRLFKEGGAAAIKMERPSPALVERLVAAGVPVMGHLGLTPQAYHRFGGNKVQARTESAVERLVEDAQALEAAGAFAVVLEAVPNEGARRVTEALTTMATIGIGAGPHCNGQVLVTTEILGFSTGPRPRYAKLYADLRTTVVDAVRCFADEVASGAYPSSEHSYGWTIR
jgi:3-methyl-2-oxobutanoate hydroxymethyltransferase